MNDCRANWRRWVPLAALVAAVGAGRASAEPPQPVAQHVIVCRDAGAGGYEAFPDVCRLRDGRLMTVFYAGYGHVSLPAAQLPNGGRIAFCTSSDEGRTWSAAQTLFDGPDDDRDPSIVELKNGRLLCNFFSLRAIGRAGTKWEGLGSWLITSDDQGKSWSAPRQIARDYYCSSPVRVLDSGRLLLGLYAASNGTAHGAVAASDDGGQTWSRPVDIDNQGERLDAETDVIQLKDGSVLAVQRQDAPSKATGRPSLFGSISKDAGQSWSPSKPLNFPGHCPYLLRAAGDILLLAHRLPDTSLHYSLDEGRTWSENVLVDRVGGAYPSLVQLRDGSVLVVYYEEGAGSSIRARRFRATKRGIEWLAPSDAIPPQPAEPVRPQR